MRYRSNRALVALLLTMLMASAAIAAPAGSAKTPADPVDLNRATAKELEALPGIGPALAARIVAHRDEHGAFNRVEDLLKVKGIGEKSFQKLRPHITVGKKS